MRYLNGTKLDNRQLRVDIDYGFEEGRQFGRGRSGGQVRLPQDGYMWTSVFLIHQFISVLQLCVPAPCVDLEVLR